MTGMPLRKIDFISSELALAEPVPFTVAILMTKSLIRAAVAGDMSTFCGSSGDLRFLRLQVTRFIDGKRPVHIGFLHVPGCGWAALRAQPAVNTQVLVLHHDTAGLRQSRRNEQGLCQ